MERTLRDRIKEAIKVKFLKSGYKSVRTEDIAKELGISKRTLYENINSKQDAIKEILIDEHHRIFEILKQNIINAAEDVNILPGESFKNVYNTIIEHVKVFNMDVINDIKINIPSISDEFNETLDCKMLEQITQIFEIAKKRGVMKNSINPKILFYMTAFAIEGIILNKKNEKLDFSIDEALNEILKIILLGAVEEKYKKNFELENINY